MLPKGKRIVVVKQHDGSFVDASGRLYTYLQCIHANEKEVDGHHNGRPGPCPVGDLPAGSTWAQAYAACTCSCTRCALLRASLLPRDKDGNTVPPSVSPPIVGRTVTPEEWAGLALPRVVTP